MKKRTTYRYRPGKQGLYNPKNEHDACGIGFVANIHGSFICKRFYKKRKENAITV